MFIDWRIKIMLKYEHIANNIEKFIENGQYQAGDKLPSVEELKQIMR